MGLRKNPTNYGTYSKKTAFGGTFLVKYLRGGTEGNKGWEPLT